MPGSSMRRSASAPRPMVVVGRARAYVVEPTSTHGVAAPAWLTVSCSRPVAPATAALRTWNRPVSSSSSSSNSTDTGPMNA